MKTNNDKAAGFAKLAKGYSTIGSVNYRWEYRSDNGSTHTWGHSKTERNARRKIERLELTYGIVSNRIGL